MPSTAVLLPFPRHAHRHRVNIEAIRERVDRTRSEAELFALTVRTLRSLAHQREREACDTETYVAGLVLAHLALARLLGADRTLPPRRA